MTIAYISHPACRLHDMGSGHPESPERLAAIEDQLIASGLEFAIQRYDAPAVTREQLERVHDPRYVTRIFAESPDSGLVWLDQDTAMNPHTLEAARRAAGAVVHAVDLVLGGGTDRAFCAVRPPGHHAEYARAMGFCLFNNIAVGAAHAMKQYGLERIAIADFDVHHGNGTGDIFEDDARVLFCSSYQHPFYPFSEPDVPGAHQVKTLLEAGSGSRVFRERIRAQWLDALDDFCPQLVMISAGFDAHWQDEVADLHLTEQDYGWITHELRRIAERHAGGRMISVLEGGYSLSALARSVCAHINAMLD